MVDATMAFSMPNSRIHSFHPPRSSELERTSLRSRAGLMAPKSRSFGGQRLNSTDLSQGRRKGETHRWRANAFPDWHFISDFPLMAVMIEHVAGQRDYVVTKSVWHLSDETIKNIYTMYIMFTCWGCCFFGSTKDPFYDSEQYRKDGGDGTVHWIYERQEDIEEAARAELLREELIEEIELKVGGLRELEESIK